MRDLAVQGSDPLPLYERIKQFILEGIRSGEWGPGARLPSEGELTARFGISRMTINRALRELAADGIIRRVQGLGSFVAERKPPTMLFELRDVVEEIRQRGRRYTCRIVTLQSLRVSPSLASRHQLPLGRPLHHSVIVHEEDGLALQVEERWVNPALVPDYLELDYTTRTTFSRLSEVGATEVEHQIRAILPDRRDIGLLGVSSQEPCLLLLRRAWAQNEWLARSRFVSPGSRYSLDNRFILAN